MEKIKKFWKEISVFGIVIVVFLGLFAYNRIMYVDYSTVSQTKVADMVKDKESFVVVVGNNNDTNTLGYQQIMESYVDKNRSEKLYYVDFSKKGDAATEEASKFIAETFKTESTSIPQVFVVKDGEVVTSHTGSLSYSRLQELYDLKK